MYNTNTENNIVFTNQSSLLVDKSQLKTKTNIKCKVYVISIYYERRESHHISELPVKVSSLIEER